MARLRSVAIVAALLACAITPAPLLHQALAATAGTLFEAAPFVLALALFGGRAARRTAALAGCGCGSGAGPAALSLPAAGLCWLTFGPAVALARFGAALLLHALRAPGPRERDEGSDPLAQFHAILLPGLGLGLATAYLPAAHLPNAASLPPLALAAAELAAGLAAGAATPCCTAAVALAAMLRVTAPLAAAGMLATAGLVPPWGAGRAGQARAQDARCGLWLLALACAALAARGGNGFVHPRLVPLLWLTIPATVVAVRRRSTTAVRFGALGPALLLVALVLGSPPPATPTATGAPDEIYAGEPIAFTGLATSIGGRTTLVRYAITCCRADASAIALPTNLHLHLPRDAWCAVSGTVARDDGGFYVRASSWRRVAAPADPYLYR